MKKLFQYHVLIHEYEDKDGKKTYKDTRMVIEPKYMLAATEKEVVFRVTREIKEDDAKNPDNVVISISSF